MSRYRRSPIGIALSAIALSAVLASAPAAAADKAGAGPTPGPGANSSEVAKKQMTRVMPPPQQPGWVDRVVGKFTPKPPKMRCRG